MPLGVFPSLHISWDFALCSFWLFWDGLLSLLFTVEMLLYGICNWSKIKLHRLACKILIFTDNPRWEFCSICYCTWERVSSVSSEVSAILFRLADARIVMKFYVVKSGDRSQWSMSWAWLLGRCQGWHLLLTSGNSPLWKLAISGKSGETNSLSPLLGR